MSEIQDCNVTFCKSFAKVPREPRERRGWDLKGGALSSLNYLTFILTLSLSLYYSHSLNLSPHSVTLSQSLSSSLPFSLALCLSLRLSHSCCLSVSISLSLSLSFLLLNELVIRIMHGDGSAKVSRKDCFLVKVAISGTRNLGQHPYLHLYLYLYLFLFFCFFFSSSSQTGNRQPSSRPSLGPWVMTQTFIL